MQVLPATFPDHASWSLQGSGGHPGRSARAQTLAWRVALARGCGLAGRSGQGGREGEPKPWSGPGAERARCRADAPPRLGADQARGTAGRRARRLSAVSARRTAPVAPTRTRPGLGGPGVPRWPGEVTAAGARRLRRGLGSWMLRPTSSGCGRPCSAPAVPGALPAHTCPLRVGVWGWSPGRRGLAGGGRGAHTRNPRGRAWTRRWPELPSPYPETARPAESRQWSRGQRCLGTENAAPSSLFFVHRLGHLWASSASRTEERTGEG
jgi:hypothetical protein